MRSAGKYTEHLLSASQIFARWSRSIHKRSGVHKGS